MEICAAGWPGGEKRVMHAEAEVRSREHISANAQKRMEMQEKCGCQNWTRDSDTK